MKKKRLIVAQDFAVGGIEKALINMLKVEGDSGYDTTVFAFTGGEMADQIPQGIKVVYGRRLLGLISTPFTKVMETGTVVDKLLRMSAMAYVRVFGSEKLYRRLLKKELRGEKYDLAISYFNDAPNTYFTQGTNLFVSDYVNADKKLAWIHSDPIDGGFDKEHCRKIYKKFDEIICVSQAVKKKFDIFLPEYKDRTRVIYNVFPADEILALANESVPFEKGPADIVTVGRIDNGTKRIDAMIRLCARLKKDGVSGFVWRIVGGGNDLPADEKLAEEMGVTDVFRFVGQQINPYPYIKNSDLFALCSAYEGYPMVIGEAQALGVPILTTEYAAAREQINESQGYVASSEEDFYEHLKKFITDRQK